MRTGTGIPLESRRAAWSQAGQDSAYWRPETASEPAPGCAPALRFPATTAAARTFRTRWPGDVSVTLATAGENAPPSCSGAGPGRVVHRLHRWWGWEGRGGEWRGGSVGGRCGGRCAGGWARPHPAATALLGARSRPCDPHPPIHTPLSALPPPPLPPAIRTGSSVISGHPRDAFFHHPN